MMKILHIAGYQFLPLTDLATLRSHLYEECKIRSLKGTILLSEEGINLNLAGTMPNIQDFIMALRKEAPFSSLSFHTTFSATPPYQRLKVKIKKEIIALRNPHANPLVQKAPSITPETFKQWLDEKQAMLILDTRNDYEIQCGTFNGAVNLHLSHFSDFPSSIAQIEHDKPVVMFCTGGIRCEKAALYLLNQGFSEVYQLEGGILGYFSKIGDAHYDGECFVFDDRVSIPPTTCIAHDILK